jgi:hypothetical protein
MKYPEENFPDHPKHADDLDEDRELKSLLGEWKTPEITSSLDQRIFKAYRRQVFDKPWWRRWLTGSINLPVPVAATAVVLLCGTSYLAMRKAASYPLEDTPGPPLVKVVEVPVPVIQEKIVTRVMYKKSGAPKANEEPALITPTHGINLANFRPVNEIKPIVIVQGGNDEK